MSFEGSNRNTILHSKRSSFPVFPDILVTLLCLNNTAIVKAFDNRANQTGTTKTPGY